MNGFFLVVFSFFFSLRTLCRALSFASDNLFGGENRSLHEAVSMSFLTDLDMENRSKVEKVIEQYLGKKPMGPLPPPSTLSSSGRDRV